MNLDSLLSQVLTITGTFNFKIALILFFLCSIGEIGFALPYILETIWLMAGYQLAQGYISPLEIFYIWLIAQAGRQTGSIVLFYSSSWGMIPLRKFHKRFIEPRLPKVQLVPKGIYERLINPSPLSIAAGRLIGLRIPFAIATSTGGKISHLVSGVLISSIIWDGVYLILGRTVGVTVMPEPVHMLFYSLGGLTAVYLIVLGVRHLWKRLQFRTREKQPGKELNHS